MPADTLVHWWDAGELDVIERRVRCLINVKLEKFMSVKKLVRSRRVRLAAGSGLALAMLAGIALPAQDKYTLQVPNGLAFSDFRGYEDWKVVAASQTDDLLKVMVANPIMIEAYRSGIPGNGSRSRTARRS